MNAKQLIALSVLAFAGSAAMADDITFADDRFVAQKSRAEVKAEVLGARAAGVVQFITEADVQPAAPAARSVLTREDVRAELRNSRRVQAVNVDLVA
jgi:hypothetical protein